MLKKLNKKKVLKEKEIQRDINQKIKNRNSFIFNAGAGSGKTYALIQSLKYVINEFGSDLKYHNQKIVVITYTNIAANEIKRRLGNSELILVSTIHERLWEIISSYNKELTSIHQDKINKKIVQLQNKVKSMKRYNNLNKNEKMGFKKVINKKQNKNIFYRYYKEAADPSRRAYMEFDFPFDINETKLLNNVGDFKRLVNNLYRIQELQSTQSNILMKKNGYKKVTYNYKTQYDRPQYMEISHDSLLEYGKRIIYENDLLKQIMINKHPYIFIDEYQDTDVNVIEIMEILHCYSKKKEHPFVVGYFGDEMQNIYEKGIGDKLANIHSDIDEINKNFNRRSSNEVINVINKIRNGEEKQESIYHDADGGSVKFYAGNRSGIEDFIKKIKCELLDDNKEFIDCFFLTNRSIANSIKINTLYDVMNNSNMYSQGLGYKYLNTELLNKDYDKLGEVQKTLYNLCHLLYIGKNKKYHTVNYLLSSEDKKKGISLTELYELIERVDRIKGDTLGEVLNEITIETKAEVKNESLRFNKLINRLLMREENNQFNITDYKDFILYKLGKIDEGEDLSDEEMDERLEKAKGTLSELLEITIDELLNWYNHLTDLTSGQVRYHTYHGTKGKEYENVIIIMENKFGKEPYFNNYFSSVIQDKKIADKALKNVKAAQNLLYVATSRAIKNLRVYYVDCIEDFKEGVESIFGKVC